MRIVLAAALLAALWRPAGAEETFDIDWMAILVIAGEKCPGHSYDVDVLSGIAAKEAKGLGWSDARIEREFEARALAELRAYHEDPQIFCIVADRGRRQYRNELGNSGAIP